MCLHGMLMLTRVPVDCTAKFLWLLSETHIKWQRWQRRRLLLPLTTPYYIRNKKDINTKQRERRQDTDDDDDVERR